MFPDAFDDVVQVHLVDAMGFFMEMSTNALEGCFNRLVEGKIEDIQCRKICMSS